MNPRDEVKARYFEDEPSKLMESLSKYFSCLYLQTALFLKDVMDVLTKLDVYVTFFSHVSDPV